MTENASAPLLDETPKLSSARLFVAVPLWGEFREKGLPLYQAISQLPLDLRWVKPENWHITLYFLGEVAAKKIPGLISALAAEVKGFTPFDMSLGKIGAFPRVSKARVLWVGAQTGKEELKNLALKAREGCHKAGIKGDSKPFEAHLTLARAKDEPVAVQVPEDLFRADWGSQHVDSIALVRSTLQKGGPVYEVLETLKF